MCLTKLASFTPNKTGYKVVRLKDDGVYRAPLQLGFKYDKTKWNVAEYDIIETDKPPYERYSSGFHIYNNLIDAKQSYFVYNMTHGTPVICEVEYEDFITGYGDGALDDIEQIVAQRMRIIREVPVGKGI